MRLEMASGHYAAVRLRIDYERIPKMYILIRKNVSSQIWSFNQYIHRYEARSK